jgi:CheY-like chemotaxis protein
MARILIVDDDPAVRSTLRKIFRNEPYEILEACNGIEALQSCRQNPVDVMITDVVMPDKEGIETIIELRRDFENIKIIAISGGGKRRVDIYLSMAKSLGADYVFNKPVPIGDLLDAVRKLMDQTNNGA